MLGITLYPWLNHAQPEDVPVTYLDDLFAQIGNIPVAVTETGWPAENLTGLNLVWETSESSQTAYVSRLEAIFTGRSPAFFNWLFLHPMIDPGENSLVFQLFSSISLRNNAGEKRPVYDTWLDFSFTD